MDQYVPQGFRGDDYDEEVSYAEWAEEKRKADETSEAVSHPPHYTFGRFEVIDVIEDWQLDFHLANAIKYIARAKHKGNFIQDLEKSVWYIQRRIAKAKEEAA